MHEIFLNYRTKGGREVAHLCAQALSARFGTDSVFLAGRSIDLGEKMDVLLRTARRSEVLLALIDEGWLTVPDRKRPARRALDNPDDWVRREIEAALDAGTLVVPVFVGRGVEQLDPRRLPGSIAEIAEYQYAPVCSQTMALTHPDQALVRLHHLARRARGPVAANARQAVLDLAGSDERLYRQMLDRLAAGLADDRWPTDRTLFTELADPLRGLGFATVRASLIACWRSVLRRPVETWAAPVRDWLTAGVDLRHRRLVLPVLAAAAATDTRVSGRVYRVALDWERAGHSDERAATVRDLLRTIDAAQGLDFHGRAA
ncbi:hypothetical protein SFUMM280S_05028 [Streptomyces fumanus]